MEINAVDENNYPLFDGVFNLKPQPMKTAMQEFIDEVEDIMMIKGQLWWHERKKKALEKEKEQLEEARLKGYGEGYHEGLYDAENK